MPKATWILSFVGAAILLLIGVLWLSGALRSKGEVPQQRSVRAIAVPSAFKVGETSFVAYCARCHGPSADGTEQGPSLLWRIYTPNHHSDASFSQAVNQGVRAHHWRFGDMPAIPDVTPDDVAQIIAYVRWLQQQAGVR